MADEPQKISILEIIQIRSILGDTDQEPSSKTTAIIESLDSIISDFVNSLAKGN